MGDMLSQDEINALLGLVDDSTKDESETNTNDLDEDSSKDESEINTDELEFDEDSSKDKSEINVEELELDKSEINLTETDGNDESNSKGLTDEEKDIIGEIGNISMGTAATTLFSLLNQRVKIDTPKVQTLSWRELAAGYDRPCVGIRVDYKEGLTGINILILKEQDVKIITNLMMGGDGTNVADEPVNEIELSAIGEAMNQMIGSASTSMSAILDKKVDIDIPRAFIMNFDDNEFFDSTGFDPEEEMVRVAFQMEIGNIIDSNIMQVLNLQFAKDLANELVIKHSNENTSTDNKKANEVKKHPEEKNILDSATKTMSSEEVPVKTTKKVEASNEEHKNIIEEDFKKLVTASNKTKEAKLSKEFDRNIKVKSAQFQDFDMVDYVQERENIEIIKDVPLEVTVELGRTKKKIKEILEFAPGTVIELNKIAGEPIDILVNGKYVASGEVVVIDENFGIRISDIISVENRI